MKVLRNRIDNMIFESLEEVETYFADELNASDCIILDLEDAADVLNAIDMYGCGTTFLIEEV